MSFCFSFRSNLNDRAHLACEMQKKSQNSVSYQYCHRFEKTKTLQNHHLSHPQIYAERLESATRAKLCKSDNRCSRQQHWMLKIFCRTLKRLGKKVELSNQPSSNRYKRSWRSQNGHSSLVAFSLIITANRRRRLPIHYEVSCKFFFPLCLELSFNFPSASRLSFSLLALMQMPKTRQPTQLPTTKS